MHEDWSAWLRIVGSTVASEALVAWAARQTDVVEAWETCPRADWLLLGIVRSRTNWRSIVACAASLARMAEPYLPVNERRPRRALDAIEAWTRGQAETSRVLEVGTGLFADTAYVADTSAICARTESHYDHQAASVAAARTAVRCAVLAAMGDQGAARAAVQVPYYAAHAPAHLGEWRTQIGVAHRALATHIHGLRWPVRRPGLDLHRQVPKLQIAWTRVAERAEPTHLTTVQLLASMSARHILDGHIHGRDPAEGSTLAAIAERIAADPCPVERLHEVRQIFVRA